MLKRRKFKTPKVSVDPELRLAEIEVELEKTQTPRLICNPPGFTQPPLDLEEEVDKQGNTSYEENNCLVCAGPDYGFDPSKRNEDNANGRKQ